MAMGGKERTAASEAALLKQVHRWFHFVSAALSVTVRNLGSWERKRLVRCPVIVTQADLLGTVRKTLEFAHLADCSQKAGNKSGS